jgi:cytochrome c oxidase cbb3-type subunit III
MSDFFSSTVGFLVAAMTLFSILMCGVLLWVQASKKLKVSLDVKSNSTGHVWDEDLQELNNPMPRWWMGLFYITIVFALVYLYFFPGLGTYQGKSDWSSKGQYQTERKMVEDRAAPLFSKFEGLKIEEIAHMPEAQAMGERLFLNNCAQCHGSDARGSRGFPNLTDTDWLYGGAGEAIQVSILEGRNGMMPSMIGAVGSDENARAVAQYVLSLSGRANDPLKAQLGRKIFGDACAACHGADGKGSQAIGAPNLSDRIWLHGGTEKSIVETIKNGRQGHMPSHKQLLTADQIRVVSSYVWQLSNKPVSAKSVAVKDRAQEVSLSNSVQSSRVE